jgi:hypothetical protein
MQEKSLIKKNILKFIEFKNITKYKFYQQTGITRGILDQDNGMSEENTTKFLAYFSDINPEWLLTGKGKMLRGEEPDAGPPAPIKLPTVEGTNLIDEIKQQAEQIGILKNENKHQNELIKKLNSEIEQLKNRIGRLQSGAGEYGHTAAKMQELYKFSEFPQSIAAEPPAVYGKKNE